MPVKKSGRKKVRRVAMLSPYAYDKVQQMMDTELFSSEAEVFEAAIFSLFEQLKQEGKLPTPPPKMEGVEEG